MDPAAWVMGAIVVVGVIALAWYTSRRHWNADREDDARRPGDMEEE